MAIATRLDEASAHARKPKGLIRMSAMPAISPTISPTISVVIPTYNRAALLRTAIESIQAQSFADWELLVVDDGSTDNTRALVENLAATDKRILYHYQAHRGFPAAGLNYALAQARGQFLYKNDDDDTSAPKALESSLAVLQAQPEAIFCVQARATRVNRKGVRETIWASPMLFRCTALRALGGWNEFYHAVEDDELFLRARAARLGIAQHDAVLYHCGPLAQYSVSRGAHVLAYRLALHRDNLWRNRGLPVPSRQGLARADVLHCLTGQGRIVPAAFVARLQTGLYPGILRNPQRHRIWHDTLQPVHALAYAPRRLSVIARTMGYMWQAVRNACLPWRVRVHALGYVLTHILPTAQRKRLRAYAAQPPPQSARAPMVSVIIPSYNRAPLLREAIASIQAQSFTNWELLVVDDGSTDDTRAVVQGFMKQDARIQYVYQKHKGFPAAAQNRALPLLRGKYIYKHDDDDVALPDKLARCVAHMDAHPKHCAVRVRFAMHGAQSASHEIVSHVGFPLFFRTSLVRALGGWNEFFHALEDMDLVTRAAAAGYGFGFLDECLYLYRQNAARRVSRASGVFSYRLVLEAARAVAAWGLPSMAVMGLPVRVCVQSLYARVRLWPHQAQHRLIRYFNHWQVTHAPAWYQFNEIHLQLTRAKRKFPYRPLWHGWALAVRLLLHARLPWRRTIPILWRMPWYYFADRAQEKTKAYQAYKKQFLQKRMDAIHNHQAGV